jgi:hypothetical protein
MRKAESDAGVLSALRDHLAVSVHLAKNSTAVFDVDGTIVTSDPKCAPLMKRAYEICREYGLQIIVMTARKGRPLYRIWTQAQLKACGISADRVMYVKAAKKAAARKALRTSGLKLLALFGDTSTDLGLAESSNRAPGTYYGIDCESGAFCVKARTETYVASRLGYAKAVLRALARGQIPTFGSLLK